MTPIRLALALLLTIATACAPTPQPEAPSPSTGDATEVVGFVDRSAMYELFVRDFSPAGTFQGVIEGLDRVEATGANVIWLMPIHPVGVIERKGTLGSSYSVADYLAVNPEYGTAADFRRLVEAVHARGMDLIIDWVPNHTAWDNPWITQHPDWYTRGADGEITEPLNDDGTSTGWTDVADLNYDNRQMRLAMIDAMRYWLEEFDIDGFRVDVAHSVPDDFWQQALPLLREAGAEILLAEAGEPHMHELGFDLTYGWPNYHALKQVWRGEITPSAFIAAELEEIARPEGVFRLRFTTNHDETAWDEPAVTLFGGPAGARAAFTAMALLPGMPLLYNGQEVESPQQLGLFEKEAVQWDRAGADAARRHYRRVVDLARTHPAFNGRALAAVTTTAPDDVIAYRRENAVVLVNVRNRPVSLTVNSPNVRNARDLLTGRSQTGDALTLPAYGAVVLQLPD